MRSHLTILAALMLASVTASAQLIGDGKVDCPYLPGVKLTPAGCEKMRQVKASDQARVDKQAADLERAAAANRAYEAEEARKRDEQAAANQAVIERDNQVQADLSKQSAAADRQAAADAKQQQALLRDRKAECGADFGELRVGMTLARAQHCVGSFKLVGQIAGPNGPVSQYRGPGYTMLNVQRGVIVHWLRP